MYAVASFWVLLLCLQLMLGAVPVGRLLAYIHLSYLYIYYLLVANSQHCTSLVPERYTCPTSASYSARVERSWSHTHTDSPNLSFHWNLHASSRRACWGASWQRTEVKCPLWLLSAAQNTRLYIQFIYTCSSKRLHTQRFSTSNNIQFSR